MASLVSSDHKEKCTLIETIHGEVKLIKRSDDSPTNLETLKFSNLKDCMEFVDKTNFKLLLLIWEKNETVGKGKLQKKIKNKILV
jgi:hypothetical protein